MAWLTQEMVVELVVINEHNMYFVSAIASLPWCDFTLCLVQLEHYMPVKWRVSHDQRCVIDVETVGVLKEMVSLYHATIIATTECEKWSSATATA